MSSPMNHRRGKLSEKSSSFHSNTFVAGTMSGGQLRRPKTVPDLVPDRKVAVAEVVLPRLPPKLLVKVTMMGSLGPVQVVLPPESTVGDLVAAAVRLYVKEGRRPILPSTEPSNFDLHYSQFSLESLNRREKLGELGSRNFFMCLKKSTATVDGGECSETAQFASCSKEADKGRKGSGGFSLMRLMDLLK
ncbi:hypothetical protein TanjilG_17100 [Lupinus angustifolius]|uniref:DUF7054 domain-containing protein n=1 Tax=Lupinus angustifolius TaxID=3871 RepID=A0A4P1R1E5_LUPAN|nr:PREDICTED: uncharacterized protein LOC109325223 [Lupinus angustifolius]OIV99290.1 hypothetical protein TanjilG_17100 [Lupinus angustifolius]